ncbi:transcription factor [Fusarium langsethiae]|uniref:Transcription factor n=1 Tax=Fusarium langsethiae TaxID=179993 RepID=A0A0N0DFY6_FUSLA|nr:transcription factor [Fusarium langsethiae]GKU01709.1 unnamed protein product [Fusarium langsethiae]
MEKHADQNHQTARTRSNVLKKGAGRCSKARALCLHTWLLLTTKSVKCPYCDKDFFRHSNLLQHQKTEHKGRHHDCDDPDCTREFKSRRRLDDESDFTREYRRGIRQHIDEDHLGKCFPCQIHDCTEIFSPLAEITGSTGNICTVHIGKRLRCTCPHHTKGGQQRAREERTPTETILALKLKKDAKLEFEPAKAHDEADQDDGLGDGAVTDEDDDSIEPPDVALAEECVYMIENEETRATFVKVGHQDSGYKRVLPGAAKTTNILQQLTFGVLVTA